MDRLTKEKRSWNMSRIRSKNTKPEIRLRSLLHKAGYRFRVHARKLPGTPDIVLPKYRTVIFVHGCFWHRHNDCANSTMPKTRIEFWESKFKTTVERDQDKIEKLRLAGWRVIIVWECELDKNDGLLIRRISEELRGG